MNTNKNATLKQSEAERQNPPTATADAEALAAVSWACVTGEVGYGDYDSETSLHDKLELIDAAIAGKAALAHTHTASSVTGLPTVAQTGDYADLLNTPTLAPVATSGSYNDLDDKPAIPTMPTSLPANGGNADTVDGMHATEFAAAAHTHNSYADVTHAHAISDITGLAGELDGKADAVHTHNYAASAHTHTIAEVSETSEKKIMTATERTKLEGVEAGANNYTHPATHAASMITGLATVATSGSYDDLSDKPTSMAPTAHTHAQSDITGLATALSGKANATHAHGTADVTGLADALATKADATHTHDYAESSHTHTVAQVSGTLPLTKGGTGATTAAAALTNLGLTATAGELNYMDGVTSNVQTQLDGKAESGHTHAQSDVTGLETALAGKASTGHTHTLASLGVTATAAELNKMDGVTATTEELNYVDGVTSNIQTQLDGKAASSHTHSGYAATNHTHNYAASNHTHDYAESDHTHDEYFSVNGGTINGETNVNGILRVKGQQAFYFNNNTQTIGTNNATGGTNIACGADATCNIGGAIQKTASVLPRSTNTYYCGNANFRWKGIYSAAAVNVSSDERLKRNIVPMDAETLTRFVEGLNVVSYNYNDDEETAKARIGLIAQDVRGVDADIAEYFVNEESDGMLSLAPADFVFPLIAAVQQLSARVRELEEKVK